MTVQPSPDAAEILALLRDLTKRLKEAKLEQWEREIITDELEVLYWRMRDSLSTQKS